MVDMVFLYVLVLFCCYVIMFILAFTCVSCPSLSMPFQAIPHLSIPCHSMPFLAFPLHALHFLAFPCHPMPSLSMPCITLPFHAMPCLAFLYHAFPFHSMSFITDLDGFRWPSTYSNWVILAVFQFGNFFLVFESLTFGAILRP
jgi:hypothetical protein